MQINELSEIREKTIEMRMNTEGDKKRYNDQIINLTNQIEALRDYLKLEKEKLQNNEKYATEIQKIDEIFLAREVEIEKYNELLIRRLISSIKVEDEKLVIILKGGLKIEEKI